MKRELLTLDNKYKLHLKLVVYIVNTNKTKTNEEKWTIAKNEVEKVSISSNIALTMAIDVVAYIRHTPK